MGKYFDDALKLLAADDLAGAEQLLARMEAEKEEIEEDGDLIEDMIKRKRGPISNTKAKSQRDLPLQPEPKVAVRLKIRKRPLPAGADRSDLIKKQAVELAKAHGGKVTVEEMKKALSGYDLGPIPGTVIANVLFKATPEWSRVTSGVYKYGGPQ